MTDFREVADRVWLARYEWWDANVTLIGGDAGLVVVDTHASAAAGRGVVADIARLGVGKVVGVVNTHWHFDHSFGNIAFREAFGPVPIHAHEEAAHNLAEWGHHVVANTADEQDPTRAAEIAETELVVPDHVFASVATIDLGDRQLELVHPGRGHTGGDLLVRIPDADVVLAGDLVEESGPPWFAHDSFPLEWPGTLDFALGLMSPGTVVVPGHGRPVDRDFVADQGASLAVIATTIGDLAARGVGVEDALAAGKWPWPREHLQDAVRRGYEHLAPEVFGSSGRQLPLA